MNFATKMLGCAAALLLSANLSAKDNFSIDGTVSKGLHDVKYYFWDDRNALGDVTRAIDSVDVKKGKFTYSANIAKAKDLYLIARFDSGSLCSAYMHVIIIPDSKLKMTVHNGYFDQDGSPFYQKAQKLDKEMELVNKDLNNLRSEMQQAQQQNDFAKLNQLKEKGNEIAQKRNEAIHEYIKEHNDDAETLLLMTQHSDCETVWREARVSARKGYLADICLPYIQKLEAEKKARTLAFSKTGIGSKFVDFSVSYEGKTYNLSDYVGKGKFTIVDFWASWCGPCRQAIPSLIDTYKSADHNKVEVLGVAVWDNPDDTKKAISELAIPYPQIINAQQIGATEYGVDGIPTIILFDPDGKILARSYSAQEIIQVLNSKMK